jgi:hypothetical protein
MNQVDLSSQAGQREECGEQKDYHKVVQSAAQYLRYSGIMGNDGSEEKSAEQRMNANVFGN